MDKKYWIDRLHINPHADVLFYQNPKLFKINTFKRESVLDELTKLEGKIKLYKITGIGTHHKKFNGKRIAICLVREVLKK